MPQPIAGSRRPVSGPFGLRLLLLVLFAAPVVWGCSALRRPDPPVDRSQDARILGDVERRLREEPSLDAARIRVEVDGAIVLLYGSVQGIDGWNCAIRNAQLVPGVATVVDYLVIERAPQRATCEAARVPRPGTGGPQPASPPEE